MLDLLKIVFALFVLFVLGLILWGWGVNIVAVCGEVPTDMQTVTPLWLLRVVGIFFAPLGAALGWFVS